MSILHTFTVDVSTLSLLKKLQAIPLFSKMRLVGGTALALQLGHRNSVDLDFFGTMNFTKEALEHELQKNGLKTSVRSESEMIKITQIENVKVDFVDYSSVIWLEQAVVSDGLCLARLKDIGAMKISAITGRGTKKDFIDLFFL
ncbi:MAG: nucleotidyl transferase AbiEii/AbiGii toxin family protein, partial [Candidatus Symbiothrix sp.]|nr:nucleotidyl transferase AbiEii/AbiGii toxin family protein [Candidatus Symbiothrix sp.]